MSRAIFPALILLFACPWLRPSSAAVNSAQEAPVSFYKQVKPILQRRCQGCHQPVSQGGKLILTSYEAFKAGGASGPAFKPGHPEDSAIMRFITGNPPAMPKNQKPLDAAEVELIRRWIAQGAKDDTPAQKDTIDAAHPPVYAAPPVITAVAWSPDGKTLAVSGYREVLLHKGDGSGLIARLIGKAHRINSLAYSPDGSLLAAVGGSPARMGEVQFWDTASDKLKNAVQLSYDELYGASFSPKGQRLAMGGADNSVRIVSVPDGKLLLKFDNHADWPFATCWTLPGDKPAAADKANETTQERTNRIGQFEPGEYIVSTGRDRAIKLLVADTGSFVDDINTFTSPYRAMVRLPKADNVLVGGDDGIPRLYQVFRTKPRTMNQEDHDLLRQYETQPGQINALAVSPDGSKFAVGGEYGEVRVYAVADGKRLATLTGTGPVTFALAFRPDGKEVAAAGMDGQVRLFDADSGSLTKAFVPVPLAKQAASR